MPVDWLHQLGAGGAAVAAGAINALAGGGTLVSFPALVGLGVPAVNANVTNTVSLLPGYLAGSWAQRDDLQPQLSRARLLGVVSAVGGAGGSVLLVVLPAKDFRVAVPYLVLLSCLLLALNDRLRQFVTARSGSRRAGGAEGSGSDGDPETAAGSAAAGSAAAGELATPGSVTPGSAAAGELATPGFAAAGEPAVGRVPLLVAVFIGAAYGGYFGAGLGIMLLAILGIFLSESLTSLNALKQALSFVANLVAALFFLFSGKVVWQLVPVMAVGSMAGGFTGGRLARVIDAGLLRRLVVVAGVAVAIGFWVG